MNKDRAKTERYVPSAPPPPPRADEFLPHSYLLRTCTITCANCGEKMQHAETFLVKVHMSMTATTSLRQLKPITQMNAPLPIGVTNLLPKEVAFCPSCVGTIPSSPERKELSETAWAASLKAQAQAQAARESRRSESGDSDIPVLNEHHV